VMYCIFFFVMCAFFERLLYDHQLQSLRYDEPGQLSWYSDGLRTVRPWFDFRQVKEIFLFYTTSKLDLGPSQPIQWVPGSLSPGLKRREREADHSSPSSAEVKNGDALPALLHMSSWHGS
jgi:hypothetical protein